MKNRFAFCFLVAGFALLTPKGVLAVGTLQGAASQAVGDNVTPISAAAVTLSQGSIVVATTTTDDGGAYSFANLTPGTYQVQMVAQGLNAAIEADVTDGVQTTVSFFRDGQRNELFAFKPAVAISPTSPQVDVNGDGIVNGKDLKIVTDCLGVDPLLDPTCRFADVDGDGVVDATDVALVIANFERNALTVPAEYTAITSLGGSQALIGGDLPVLSNDGGATTLAVDVDPANPRQASFTVEIDRGTAFSPFPPMPLSFTENALDPTTGVVNLDTGQLTGKVTLQISGLFGADKVPITGDVTAGQLVFAPNGFMRYYSFARGTLPLSFPVIGGLAFSLSESNDKKKDVDCPQVPLATHPECNRGTECAVPAVEGVMKCAKNGFCGLCRTKATPPDICACACI